ncbi:MBL fold metallo-hydrolase [Mycobacterium sp. ITM-2016-00318]|uniref:MBL fold metallo-hydrolase n=1 Tax=Mycobacterium sp. ITM-2016-00318 TaxID=2099693 RepID=UPI000CFA07B2|nr:MBL fold metallo-hydrolase [Mycobacterium sp. ITM-2016-00318]WNG92688.1 MBL fold metallo-hydrolase [Mycobacterium sp. ITM-2016-00318]
MVDRIELGAATLIRVVEWQVGHLPLALFPQTPPEAWRDLAAQFSPTFWTDEAWRIALQTWVVEVDGLTVLVDTGAGNGRDRAAMAPLDHLDTDYLEALQRAGVEADAVDVVVNTHLHSDHVGWNTKRDNDSWVPTFPNARYLVPEADYRHFHPENASGRPQARTEDEQGRREQSLVVWADSIAPVDDAGQIELWSQDHRISESLRLRPAPGHSPGSSVLWLDAGRPAVFVGDLTHSPVQLHRPDDPCAFDEDPVAAAVTRKRVLTDASRRRAPVIPAHYPGHGGATVVARGDAFMIDDWLEISAL